ncbi:hypothetical protein PCASD_09141 [Puccinia coronata f. sp. avenae]|uniref:Uncharacterized protein n=1 Tax=Puccinia coronata f. sp. avenae TaxID=200324 RepID=A0A2N5V4T8_9BASI|nr:hypothetical protein PCASD_09141 [Puccinia coronata f. sp. avenae]
MVPKRLNDALVQLQSCSSPADAFESKRPIYACFNLTLSKANASIGRFWFQNQKRPIDTITIVRQLDASGHGTRSAQLALVEELFIGRSARRLMGTPGRIIRRAQPLQTLDECEENPRGQRLVS